MKKRLTCATLLALGGGVLAGGSSVGAAPTSSCDPGGKLITASTPEQVSADFNGNGLVCEDAERYHGTKKKGPGGTTYTYYDDTPRKK